MVTDLATDMTYSCNSRLNYGQKLRTTYINMAIFSHLSLKMNYRFAADLIGNS